MGMGTNAGGGMGFKSSQPIEPGSVFARTIERIERLTRAERVVVVVTTKEDGLEEKRAMFERVAQYIVDDHIKVFGPDMLRPGITKIGFDSEFELELLPVPYKDIFMEEEAPSPKFFVDKHNRITNTCSHTFTELVNNGNDVFYAVCKDCKRKV